ncbi:MAG: Serine/threonine kinase [Ramalina farinacea]|uniref:Serine/threonine kinase n=1 Tax=Ramalina farinacea TaxID=258253 RepID=A0AA43TZ00_9LECA|nr:Serine/threonine kinase [Ramalina farinacea]
MGNSNGKPVVFTDEAVNLNHFRLLRVVGKGAFGKVRIVERKDTGLTFALKYIRKDEVVRSESVRNIIRERKMLEHLNHAFLCNLRYSFQDIEYLYIVVDLMNGGDLRFHISRKTFTEDAVRFWMAELGCALKYIHAQGVVHRDLKPDNVLLDSDGHVHLADFNVASEYKPEKQLHSKSGTLAYLAPERPFTSHGHEKLEKEITKASPNYPVTQPPVSMPCLHAITSLLEKDRRKRIGAIGFDTFTDHPFFRRIDFDMLHKKQIPPVFVPSSEKTNFDATYDLEELLLEEAPLEARARRQKPRVQLKDDATDKEIRIDELHRMIETLFEPFDYTTVTNYKGFVDSAVTPTTSIDLLDKRTTASDTTESATSPDQLHHRPLSNGSNNGSPPMSTSGLHNKPSSSRSEYYNAHEGVNPGADSPPPLPPHAVSPSPGGGGPSVPPPTSDPTYQPGKTTRGGTRSASKSGGMQVVLDETGSWSELANRDASGGERDSRSGGPEYKGKKPAGMLGFLSRKKGRERSPKPMEKGVLGKEGARVVVGNR